MGVISGKGSVPLHTQYSESMPWWGSACRTEQDSVGAAVMVLLAPDEEGLAVLGKID